MNAPMEQRSTPEHAPAGLVMILMLNGTLRYIGPGVAGLLGYRPAELVGRSLVALLHPDDAPDATRRFRGLTATPGTLPPVAYRVRCRDGAFREVEFAVATLLSERGAVGLVVNAREVAEHAEARPPCQSEDAGVAVAPPSPDQFDEQLDRALQRAKRYANRRVAVLVVAIDHWGQVDRQFGYPAGDELVSAFVERARTCLRPGDPLVHLGGGTFAVLLDELASERDLLPFIERLQGELDRPFTLGGWTVRVPASIGVALSGATHECPAHLLRAAGGALEREKARITPPLVPAGTHARSPLRDDGELRRALERQEFRLHYQPVYGLKRRRVTGVEALLRWQHPEHGLLPPAAFVPLAEQAGLLAPIGQWVLQEAMRQTREWQRRFPFAPALTLAVNLSPQQLVQPSFEEEVARLLSETGLAPGSLSLELNARVLGTGATIPPAPLWKLRMALARVQLDDFDAGASSLLLLHRFPLDAVKLDRALVHRLDRPGEQAALVKTILTLARPLGVTVTAKGVETAAQLRRVHQLKCHFAQGYLLSIPLDADAATAFLRAEYEEYQRLGLTAAGAAPDEPD